MDVSPSLLLKWGVDLKHESARVRLLRRGAREPIRPDSTFVVDDTTRVDHRSADRPARRLSRPANPAASAPSPPKIGRPPRPQLAPRRVHGRSRVESHVVSRATGTTLRGAWGRYSQTQPLFALQASDGVDRFAAAEHAEQRCSGWSRRCRAGSTARIEAYDRRTRDARPMFVNAGGDLFVFPEIRGTACGSTARRRAIAGSSSRLSRANAGRTDWSVSYALASSKDIIGGRSDRAKLRGAARGARRLVYWPTSNAWR